MLSYFSPDSLFFFRVAAIYSLPTPAYIHSNGFVLTVCCKLQVECEATNLASAKGRDCRQNQDRLNEWVRDETG